MITQQVTFGDFWHWLKSSEGYKDNFSYEGAEAVFNYMDELSEETESEADNFDPIAWCCEFSEYESFEELQGDYDNIETMDDLQDRTIVVSESPLVIVSF